MIRLAERGATDVNATATRSGDRARLPRLPMQFGQWRPSFIAGGGNRVMASGLGGWIARLRTSFRKGSRDNVVVIGRNFRTYNLTIRITGDGNRIDIGDDVQFNGRIEVRGSGTLVRIGDRSDFKTTEIIACFADVEVGSDCLVAGGVHIRTSDMHTIVDRANGHQVNAPRLVSVGSNVWIAKEAALLKGAAVPDGCVVGFRSVVTRRFEEVDCILAGSPARIVRRGISWSR